jgi:hypothetical protein
MREADRKERGGRRWPATVFSFLVTGLIGVGIAALFSKAENEIHATMERFRPAYDDVRRTIETTSPATIIKIYYSALSIDRKFDGDGFVYPIDQQTGVALGHWAAADFTPDYRPADFVFTQYMVGYIALADVAWHL